MFFPAAILGGGLGGSEILLIMAVALIFFGSKNLPMIARNLGKIMEEFKRASRQVSQELLKEDLDAKPEQRIPPLSSIREPMPRPENKDDSHHAGS